MITFTGREVLMKAVIQRANEASVNINGRENRSIGRGLVIFLGVGREDGPEDVNWLVHKIASMRLFEDESGRTNLSTADIDGEMLVVSQFTLLASTRKGNRPSLDSAAPPETAIPLYELFVSLMKSKFTGTVQTGEFGAHMQVSLVNDGPFTILLDSKVKT
jgi:D-tyrosyl-tRNA(Tyr) deacylase